MVNVALFTGLLGAFIALTLFLGWYGHKHTKNKDNFLLGRNKSNPILIGLAYGATFLSTSAIVGFGGVASLYGMSMVWLVFLNLFVGLIIAFIIFGKRTRRLNVKLGALTFADFLGKRFRSPFIRVMTAIIVIVGMPIYCAAVMTGGVSFLDTMGIGVDRNMIILVLAVVILLYVVYGGIIAVMYNDALQAALMFAGMFVILLVTYFVLSADHGGITGIHSALTDLWATNGHQASTSPTMQGTQGWTIFPDIGSNAGIYFVSTILMGVGIGALAQPQLAARFMTAKDTKTLNRSLAIGGIFMLVIVGAAYTVGALTNLYFVGEMGKNALQAAGAVDRVIPLFVNTIFGDMGIMGELFIILFTLGILCAAISTISALLHTMGAAAGHDLWSEVERKKAKAAAKAEAKAAREESRKSTLKVTRIATVIMMIVVVILTYAFYYVPGFAQSGIIAKATAIFMGLTAAALLPTYTHAVYTKKPNALAAKLSILVGSISWLFWALFINYSTASTIKTPLLLDMSNPLVFVDPMIVALPLSVIAMIIVLFLRPANKDDADAEPVKQDDKQAEPKTAKTEA
ncbi:MAG: sodium:solute symporter family protein [Methanomassiliicoccaceae archaeon]|jgi:SSS family solute:Na+ symporter|nr:sodium:solute symporter family protein [Methanomassiliicoccaceae archaeon]